MLQRVNRSQQMNVKKSQELKFLLKLFCDKVLFGSRMPVQRCQIVLVIKLGAHTFFMHLAVLFSHANFLDSPWEYLYFWKNFCSPNYLFIVSLHMHKSAIILCLSADLRFITFLLSKPNDVGSRSFFTNYVSVTPRSHKRHQMDFKLTSQYHNIE